MSKEPCDKNLILSKEASQALWQLLQASNPRGRAEVRLCSHVQRAMKEKVISSDNGQIEGGMVEITRLDAFTFVQDKLEEKFKAPLQGAMAIGYEDLDEAVKRADSNGQTP